MKRYLPTLPPFLVLFAVGCGSGFHNISGTVTDENGPVKGATVVFEPEDGKNDSRASGFTDDSGHYTLTTGSKKGAKPGKYSIIITKVSAKQIGGEGASMEEKMKMMSAESSKGTKGGGAGGAGLMPGKGMGPPKGLHASELPAEYASLEKTPLKGVTVPGGDYNFTIKGSAASSGKKK